MITLTVNGKPREVEDSLNLDTYLQSFGVNARFIAVGYNGQVVKKDQFPRITLQDGDTLEIVRPVGGG